MERQNTVFANHSAKQNMLELLYGELPSFSVSMTNVVSRASVGLAEASNIAVAPIQHIPELNVKVTEKINFFRGKCLPLSR